MQAKTRNHEADEGEYMENTILEMHQISKSFPGVKALSHVNLSVRKGEVHAIIGENGAGKSTLMKVLGGVYQPDEGEILINGRKVEIASPSESIAHKIGIIYQEFNLVQTLDVAENIFLGHEICDRMKFMSSREMHQRAQEVMTKLGINHFDCRRKIRDLSVAMQQLVEIAKAMFYEINILVMDEPTAVLTDRETQGLFKMISSLKDKGISIIYISHRLEEIVQIADSITILRDGCNVEVVDNRNHDVDKEYLVSRMVGRKLENYYPEKTVGVSGEVRLEVKNLSHKGIFEDISFQVHKGEILGFSGLVGAGRSEIMKTVFGAMQKDSGTVLIDGKTVNIKSPEDARNHGLSLAPENRKLEGLNIGMSIEDNITLASHNEISRAGFFIESRKRNMARKYVDDCRSIRLSSVGK